MWNSPEAPKEDECGASVGSWHDADTEDSEVSELGEFLPSVHDVALRHVRGPMTLIQVSDEASNWCKILKEDAQESS